MTATSLLLILVGVFVIINAGNFVGVLKGTNKLGFAGSKLAGAASGVRAGATGYPTSGTTAGNVQATGPIS